MINASITPKFDSNTIYHDFIGADWIEFQLRVYELGYEMLSYLQQYITSQIKSKESTGNLVRSITLEEEAGAGAGRVAWGIGNITQMNQLAPYWRLLDVGGSTFKGDYHFVPGFFDGGVFKYNPMMPEGKMLPSGTKGILKPMNFTSISRFKMDAEINKIITTIRGA